ncbi:putative quinol monooxygenase [Yoonia litorea]|uniref:Quinol monooxygenase YgiN n=1 Tax=Yoonia litorea TaxID=1123755 RepID=A0A1I6L4A6_9RHOB|nr:putative quinol monooxygenase [Yoonia litorea]SFR98289.1 Quinol monooxygenase YgiN [Yoonia litorea]
MIAVCVTLEIKSGSMDNFMPLLRANASTSLALERECHRFDIATDSERPESVFLYELYTDRSAFEAHLASAHFLEFDRASADMVAKKDVTIWGKVEE